MIYYFLNILTVYSLEILMNYTNQGLDCSLILYYHLYNIFSPQSDEENNENLQSNGKSEANKSTQLSTYRAFRSESSTETAYIS